jgi:hypothetical protein
LFFWAPTSVAAQNTRNSNDRTRNFRKVMIKSLATGSHLGPRKQYPIDDSNGPENPIDGKYS